MAIRTIAAGGGNWNSTSTWVEGVVPVTGDVIVGNSTSGNLTMNINIGTFAYVCDFTNYSATWSFASTSITMPSLITGYTTSTFSSTMTIAYTSETNLVIRTTNGSYTYTFLGNGPYGEFPTFTNNATSGILTINGIFRVKNFTRNNTVMILNGGTMSLQKLTTFNGYGSTTTGTTKFVFDREIGEFSSSWNELASHISNPIVINTTGTFSITPTTAGKYAFLGIAANGSLQHLNGNIVGQKNLHISNATGTSTTQQNTTATLDLASSGTWSSIKISDTAWSTYTTSTFNAISLTSDLYFDELRLQVNNNSSQVYGGRDGYRIITRFTGNGRLKGGYIYGETTLVTRSDAQFAPSTIPFYENGTYFNNPRLQLSTGTPSHQLSGIRMSGLSYTGSSASYAQIASVTPGTKSYLNITSDPNCFGVWFSDIDASEGLEVKTYFGDTTNSINITSEASLPTPGGGGGGGSFTYVN